MTGGPLGLVPELRRDPLAVAARALREGGDVTAIAVGPPGLRLRMYAVYTPEGAQHVLHDAADRYRKASPGYREVTRLLGHGLLTSEGPRWRRQRRFVAPLFSPRRLDGYGPLVAEEAERMVARWRAEAARGPAGGSAVVDAHEAATRFTLQVIGRVLFGADLETVVPVLRECMPVIGRGVLRRATSVLPPPLWSPTPGTRELAGSRRRLYAVVDSLVAERVAAGGGGDDLLGRLLAARDPETGAALSPAEVRDQVLVFLLAGHETTATTVATALHLLARHPLAQARLHAEVDALGAGPLGADDLARLPWATQVVKEALRLVPPVFVVPRSTPVGDVVSGVAIPPRSPVVVHVWGIHRNPRVWPQPLRFDPARFDPEVVAARHRCAWLPFGTGARACIGAQLAMLEAPLAVAAAARAFTLTADEVLGTTAGIVLRPAGPVPVRVTAR